MATGIHGYSASTRDELIAALRMSGPARTATGAPIDRLPHRLALLAASTEELDARRAQAADALASGDRRAFALAGGAFYGDLGARRNPARAVCLFPGLGVQRTTLLQDLVEHSAVVERWLDGLGERLPGGGREPGTANDTARAGVDGRLSTLSLDSVLLGDLAVWQWLRHLGLAPDALVGHSFGELAMLVAAGIVDDHAALVGTLRTIDALAAHAPARHARLGMVALSAASRPTLESFLSAPRPRVFLALDNCPQQVVVWGEDDALVELVAAVEAHGHVAFRLPQLGQPVHTPLFPLSRAELRSTFAALHTNPPALNAWSAATMELLPSDDQRLLDALVDQWHQPVRFRGLVERLHRDGADVWVEVGAGGRLSGFVRDCLRGTGATTIPTNLEGRETSKQLLTAAAQLFVAGLIPDLDRLDWREPAAATKSAPIRVRGLGSTTMPDATTAQLEAVVASQVARLLDCRAEHIDPAMGFFDLGLTSLDCVTLVDRIADASGLTLSQTLAFERPSVREMAAALERAMTGTPAATRDAARATAPATDTVAVVGIGCRFPGGGDTPDAFWRVLVEGRDAVGRPPTGRWASDLDEALAEAGPAAGFGAFLDDIAGFDAPFFGISPREALALDPQQRLLLEVVWQALEDAAIDPRSLAGTRTGVFVGISNNDYSSRFSVRQRLEIGGYLATGNTASTAAGRIAYVLGLQGPALAIDTACSSSLAAVHLARESLARGECDLAVVGGVNLIVNPETTIFLSRARALSPTGRCRTFDASADGYVRGEGCGVVVLKRLSAASHHHDRVYGVIRGSAMNHDGKTSGLTVPSSTAQEAVIREALSTAGCEPADIGYVEAHGTGTGLGDPIEVQALVRVFGAGSGRPVPRLGAAKTNIGHLEAAAGVAGLIKVLLQLTHGRLAPSLHLQTPNPRIEWPGLADATVATSTEWAGPRRAGVSAFGISGTNVHVVVDEAPVSAPAACGAQARAHVFPLSARSPLALRALADRLATDLARRPEADPASVSRTLAAGRAHHAWRAAFVAADWSGVLEGLRHVASGEALLHEARGTARPRVALLCPGQGAQLAGMGRELSAREPQFARAFDACCARFAGALGVRLTEVMWGADPSGLDRTLYAQPALFAFEYALAMLWRHWGVSATAALGHSLGEVVAACLAGIVSLDDAVTLVAARARAMNALPHGGAMLVVHAHAATVDGMLREWPTLSTAAVNADDQVVVSGDAASISALAARLEREGTRATRLPVSHAFHSALMDPAVEPFRRAVANLEPSPARMAVYANTTGDVGDETFGTADYWARHLRGPVRFAEGLRSMLRDGVTLGLEVGPRAVLTALAARSHGDAAVWIASVRSPDGEHAHVLGALGQLYEQGVDVDWRAVVADTPGPRAELPGYPFERERFWLDADSVPSSAASRAGDTDATVAPAGRPAVPEWRGRVAAASSADRLGVAKAYVAWLARVVLGIPAGRSIDVEGPLVGLGLDSLMALQLVFGVQRDLGVRLRAHDASGDASIASIAALIETRFASAVGPAHANEMSPPSTSTRAPLSYGQRALWFVWKLAPTSTAYHQSMSLEIARADRSRWRAAADRVARKHPMLRTVVRPTPDDVEQEVTDAATRWTEASCADGSAETLAAAMAAAHEHPFDLETDPPVRFHWVVTGGESAVLLVTMHHIACDAWSLELLKRDLVAAATGADDEAAPRHSYLDFVRAQQDLVRGERGERSWRFWRARLDGAPRLELPLDRPRPALQSFRGASVGVALPGDAGARARALAARLHVTPFVVWLAAYVAVLARWSRQRDFVIGAPTSGRGDPRFAAVVGYFVDPVAIRATTAPGQSFADLVRAVQAVVTDALAHADLPFPLLVERLKGVRDPSRSPVFDVTFNFHSRRAIADRAVEGTGRDAVIASMPQADGKFDLTFTVVESETDVGASLGYNVDLFEPATMERLAGWVRETLAAATEDPWQAVDAIPRRDEWDVLPAPVCRGRSTDLGRLVPVSDQIVDAARRWPSRTAVVARDGTLDYSQLAERSRALAADLVRLGVGPDTRVALRADRTTSFIVSMLAILRAGAAFVPIDTSLPAGVCDDMRRDVGAALSIVDGRVETGSGRLPADERDVDRRKADLRDLAYVIFTSGSTGRPKGVGIEHLALSNYVASIVEDLALVEGGSFACVSTLAADLGHTMVFPALVTGGTLHLLDEASTDRRAFAAYLLQHEIDYLKIVPSHLAALVEPTAPVLPKRALVLGGEATSTAWLETVIRSGACRVFNHYGPTETTVGVMTFAMPPGGAVAGDTLPLSRAVANVSVWLLDEAGRGVPRGATGEVYVSGPCVARGYVGDDVGTRERFAELPGIGRAYRTGDLARVGPDGALVLAGRADRQVKVRGHRVEPGYVEARLVECALISRAVVLPTERQPPVTSITAWVVPAAGSSRSTVADDGRRWLQSRVPASMVPGRIIVVDRLPVTPNGKLDTAALYAEADRRVFGTTDNGRPPRDMVEWTLERIWKEVLGVTHVGPADDFFHVGGHSLLAVRMASLIESELGVRLPLATFFTHATLEDLARAIREAASGGSPDRPVIRLGPDGQGAPLICFPGAGGSPLYFRGLVESLPALGPVWAAHATVPAGAVSAAALDASASIPAQAALYADGIQAALPGATTVRLVGHSFGALVAYEVAHRLQGRGVSIEWLGVLDNAMPWGAHGHDAVARDEHEWVAHIALRLERLYGLDLRRAGTKAVDTTDGLSRALLEARVLPPGTPTAAFARYVDLYKAHARAASLYRPTPCRLDTPITLFRASQADEALGPVSTDQDQTLGWARCSETPVEVRWVSGTHITMLNPPQVSSLSAEVATAIRRAARSVDRQVCA